MKLLCAGAARGLIVALQDTFLASTGVRVDARFGAVGAMKEALLAGEPCDVMIVTAAMVAALQAEGRLLAGTEAALGRVRTGVAVREGEALPDIASPASLKASLLAASAIYVPDAERSTAGIHFASVLARLGIAEPVAPRLRSFANGAEAMGALASATRAGAIGCTQITEIRYTPGIVLVDALPAAFELATVYTAALSAGAAEPELARRFVALVAGAQTRALRARGGFEFTA